MERFHKADVLLKIFEKVFGDFAIHNSPDDLNYGGEPYIEARSYNGEYMEQHYLSMIERFLLMCRDRNKPVKPQELL
jgi:hypothetical protein